MSTWSEKNGRTDITVHGFNWVDNVIVSLGGLFVVATAILVIAGLS